MIRTESEYNKAIERLEEERKVLERQKAHFEHLGYQGEELDRLLQPMISFNEQLKEEVTVYEQMKRGDLGVLKDFNNIGRWLIGLRIAKGLSQSDLADRLEVSPAQVCRDEVNEYHGITMMKAQKILDTLGIKFEAEIEGPVSDSAEMV